MSAATPGQADPWRILADLAAVLYRGSQHPQSVRSAALGILDRNTLARQP